MVSANTQVDQCNWIADHMDNNAFQEAADSFAARLAQVDGLKTFPVVAREIITLLSNPNFRVGEVTNALEGDPSLTAGVMRVANSAFFASSRPTSSIHQAFVRLGRRSVQEIVAAVATMDLFPDSGGIGKRIRDHCASTAAIAQALAKDFAPGHTEGLFLGGLMHDVGKMLLMESKEFDYEGEDLIKLIANYAHIEEQGMLGFDHAVLGAYVTSLWKIPAPIPSVIGLHHQPMSAYKDNGIGPMVALLRVADQLDALLIEHPYNYEEQLESFAQGIDCAQVLISADDLKERWTFLAQTRAASLELFGS